MAGKIQGNQIELRKQRGQPVEGIGVVQPAMQRERWPTLRVAPQFSRDTAPEYLELSRRTISSLLAHAHPQVAKAR